MIACIRFIRAAGLAALLAGGIAATARAQGPTPEGTVITNTSSVSFTDANGNTYTPATASASVTVGFTAGITFAGAASVSPASPSTGDTVAFTYTNIGNGNDSLRVTESISIAGIMTVTGYRVNGTAYGTLAALNTALAGILVAQNGTLVVKVAYNVAAAKGGLTTNYTLTGFSRRTGTATQAAVTAVNPAQTAGVAVTPDNGQNLTVLPSNGTNYTFTFAVLNSGNGTDNFNLVASHPKSAITIVSVNGTAGSSATITGAAAGSSTNVNVVYTIGNVAAGTKDTLVLTATSVVDNTVHDPGSADLTVIRAALAITKVAYMDDQVTPIGASLVVPGQYIQYKVTVTNSGAAPASTVEITDPLSTSLTYVSAVGDAGGWTITTPSGVVTADLSGTLAAAASRYIWIRARVK